MSLRALAILGVALAVGGGLDAQQQVFRTGTDVVLVDVLVTRDRRAVTDLQVHDFEVLDNGVRQTVEIVESGHLMPIDLTLLTDVSASIADPVLQRMQTAIPQIQQLLGPDDSFQVLRFASVVREAPVEAVDLSREPESHGTALWEALAVAMMQAPHPARRRVVVVLTDGVDSNSFVFHPTLRAVASRSDAILHVIAFVERVFVRHVGAIAFRGDGRGAVGLDQYFWMLEQASVSTGGAFHTVRSDDEDFLPLVNDALGELRKRYLLRYSPTGVAQEGWHRLEVNVLRKGRYEVQARRGYEWRQRQ